MGEVTVRYTTSLRVPEINSWRLPATSKDERRYARTVPVRPRSRLQNGAENPRKLWPGRDWGTSHCCVRPRTARGGYSPIAHASGPVRDEYLAEDPTVNRLKGYGGSSFADCWSEKSFLVDFCSRCWFGLGWRYSV